MTVWKCPTVLYVDDESNQELLSTKVLKNFFLLSGHISGYKKPKDDN